MIVVDASVLTNALTDDGPIGQVARAVLGTDVHWAAPEHCAVETFSAVRGRFLGGRISRARAEDALDALASAVIDRVDVLQLLPRMWELRDKLSGYDAAYVAAAELLECPLVTADLRLARVPGVGCDVRVVVPTAH